MPTDHVPSWRACRQAARAVRAAEHGRDAVERFRPRGVSGLVRSRPPLAVLLWLAAHRGLLIWRSADEFAVLDPPRGGPLTVENPRPVRKFGAVDRWWDVLVFAVPAFTLLLTAVAAGLTRTDAGTVVALLLVVATLLWVLVMMLGVVLRGALELFRTVERRPDANVPMALNSVLFSYWSIALVHWAAPDLPASAAELVEAARSRVTPVAGAAGSSTDLLLYVDAVISTGAARLAVNRAVASRRWLRDGGPVVVRLEERRRPPRPGTTAANSGSGITLLLGAVVVCVLVEAEFVAAAERVACAARDCADAPTSYLRALGWLAGRVLPFAAPDRLVAVSGRAELLGRLATVLGYVVISCVAVALARSTAAHRAYQRALQEELIGVYERRPTVALVTALPVEFFAVRALLDDAVDVGVPGDRGRYVVGRLPSADPGNAHEVVLVEPPVTGTTAAATACTNLSRSFPSVNLTVMVGIAAGVPRPDDPPRHVRLGDVVVSTWGVVDYDHVTDFGDRTEPRRSFPRPSPLLASAANRLAADQIGGDRPWERWLDVSGRTDLAGFTRPPEDTDVLRVEGPPPKEIPHPAPELSGRRPGLPTVLEGRIGSADRALNSATARDVFAHRYGLIALEMEGAGIGGSAFLQGLEWMVVRGISDYGDGRRDDRWKPYASLAAAAYTRALLQATPPQGPRGGQAFPAAPDLRQPGTAFR
jgi:nucleoside phosphorylase